MKSPIFGYNRVLDNSFIKSFSVASVISLKKFKNISFFSMFLSQSISCKDLFPFISFLIKLFICVFVLVSCKTLIKVIIAGIITEIPITVAIVEYCFLLAAFAYLCIGKRNNLNTKNVANAIKIVLIMNKYIAPKKYVKFPIAKP
ncbi:MAG: Uncharacterised protein [Polaribacter sp. SA4-10]|nr:MAG: Uncharacterised protein [Polaribacter sp. SA4-10]